MFSPSLLGLLNRLLYSKNSRIQTQADFVAFDGQEMTIAVKGGLDGSVTELGLNKNKKLGLPAGWQGFGYYGSRSSPA